MVFVAGRGVVKCERRESMQERFFSLDDQINFAILSGDYNKLHIDEVAARRYLFGKPIVHGTHMLLWAVDKWLEKTDKPIEFVSLRASFRKPLAVGERVKSRMLCEGPNHVMLELYGEDQLCAMINGEWRFSQPQKTGKLSLKPAGLSECRVLTSEDVKKASGELDVCLDKKTAGNIFPNLVRNLPLLQIAQLLTITRLVGMECPGFHSLFDEIDVIFQRTATESPVLKYKVTKFDKRFSLVVMEVKGPSMAGSIKAFLRPPQRNQMSYSDIRSFVAPDEFKEQTALIIGGSRGLGEVASKLLAAGGARVVLTYFKGRDDVQKVADEIISGGGKAAVMFFNVLAPEEAQIDKMRSPLPTHLYYFATPHITANRETFSTKLFTIYCDYYVAGFIDTLEFFLKYAPTIKKVFYPSSVFVETLPLSFVEYAAAKAAGELICNFFEKAKEGVSIHRSRLPKMATDQTVSMMLNDAEDPVPIMLKRLREFS